MEDSNDKNEGPHKDLTTFTFSYISLIPDPSDFLIKEWSSQGI
jgi:hypothetical protein